MKLNETKLMFIFILGYTWKWFVRLRKKSPMEGKGGGSKVSTE